MKSQKFLAGSHTESGKPVQTLQRRVVVALLFVVLVLFVAAGQFNLRELTSAQATAQMMQQAVADQESAAQIIGGYSGNVDLNVTVGGTLSDTLAPPTASISGTANLGSIDLSLQLTQTGNTVSGYVNLDKTLVFSVAHTLGSGNSALKIGPYLNGSFNGTNLNLLSEQVSMTVSGKTILRQFRLTGTSTSADGSQIKGEYRETLWGFASVPITVIGNFTLQRPVFSDNVPTTTNAAPLAVADSANTTTGKAVTISVLSNDSDPNNDTLTITSLSKPQFGTATISGKNVIYTPNANFSGTDTFSYVVSDGKGNSTAGSVIVTVTEGNSSSEKKIFLPLVSR